MSNTNQSLNPFQQIVANGGTIPIDFTSCVDYPNDQTTKDTVRAFGATAADLGLTVVEAIASWDRAFTPREESELDRQVYNEFYYFLEKCMAESDAAQAEEFAKL